MPSRVCVSGVVEEEVRSRWYTRADARATDRGREGGRQRETDTERKMKRYSERERERERARKRESEKDRERERERDRGEESLLSIYTQP